ncbi:MAG: CHASE2 domain-containing protein [Spirochaetota bacterium]|nr:CHASE2 domain-containing protein [Spirochaetota bacterium]
MPSSTHQYGMKAFFCIRQIALFITTNPKSVYRLIKKSIQRLQDFIGNNNLSGIIVALISLFVIVLFSYTEMYEVFEVRLYDLRFKIKPMISEWDKLVFLNIDESSINNVGEYPWPRHKYANGLGVLKEVGIRQVTFDFEFQDHSLKQLNREKIEELNNKIEKGKRIRRNELAAVELDNDKMLADGIRYAERVILPYHFKKETLEISDIDNDQKEEIEKARRRFVNRASIQVPMERIDEYKGLIDPDRVDIAIPIPELVKAAHSFGFVDRDPDTDGIERRIRLVRLFQGRIYFHMGLVMLMDIYSVNNDSILINPGESIILKDAINPISYQREDISIPIDKRGMMYINWAGPGPLEESFQHLSFYSLLEYPLIKEEIYDFFDEQERLSGITERSRLYGELAKRYNEYNSVSDLSIKREKSQNIEKIRSKIRDIEKGYAKPITEEIHRIEGELIKAKSSGLEEELYDLKNYLKAINIVMRVENLRDKIAIIGLTATGTQDLGTVTIYPEFMMVGIHHNIVNTIINKSFIYKIGRFTNYCIMFILAIIMGIVTQRMGARISVPVIIMSLFFINLLNIILFAQFNILFDELGATLAIFLPSATIAAIKFMREESQKRFIKHAFSHYLSPKVIDEIIKEPELLKLGGESRFLTIFFSDVAQFSAISEALSPTDLVHLLNEYLSEMTDIILKHNGTVDKYEGDAIMAFYGAPQHLEDHAIKACLAAIDMQNRLKDMRMAWRKHGKHELYVRMGLNTGVAVVGNMGSRTRMDYTVMGDSVNLASRLEGANKNYETYTMISESTYNAAKDHIVARQLDVIQVVGKDVPIQVYELIGKEGELSDQTMDILNMYNNAVEHFRNRDWKKARSLFRSILKISKDDGPSKTYYERCYEFSIKPPPKNWDGVYKLKSK